MATFIKKFKDITPAGRPDVGGKNASLGEMLSQLHHRGITAEKLIEKKYAPPPVNI